MYLIVFDVTGCYTCTHLYVHAATYKCHCTLRVVLHVLHAMVTYTQLYNNVQIYARNRYSAVHVIRKHIHNSITIYYKQHVTDHVFTCITVLL
jgi:hypothetical protein